MVMIQVTLCVLALSGEACSMLRGIMLMIVSGSISKQHNRPYLHFRKPESSNVLHITCQPIRKPSWMQLQIRGLFTFTFIGCECRVASFGPFRSQLAVKAVAFPE